MTVKDIEDKTGEDSVLLTMSADPTDTVLRRTSNRDSSSESWEDIEGVSSRRKDSLTLNGRLSTSFVAMAFICQSS
jgi:hypothetical protein